MNKTWRKVTATIAAILIGGATVAYAPILTASPAPVGAFPLADRHGITVKMVNGPLICGTAPRPAGCFMHMDIDSVYVLSGQTHTETTFVVAHEVAHVLQYRSGQRQDECAADAFAESKSSRVGTRDC